MGVPLGLLGSSHAVSFLLGSALSTTLFFFLASDRLIEWPFSVLPVLPTGDGSANEVLQHLNGNDISQKKKLKW